MIQAILVTLSSARYGITNAAASTQNEGQSVKATASTQNEGQSVKATASTQNEGQSVKATASTQNDSPPRRVSGLSVSSVSIPQSQLEVEHK